MAAESISLKEHLKRFGWKNQFFDGTGCFARIGLAGFEPFHRRHRIFGNDSLRVEKVLPLGSQVKFLKSLAHVELARPTLWDIVKSPVWGTLGWIIHLYAKWKGEYIDYEACHFSGYVSSVDSFNNFPFDEFLSLISMSTFEATYVDGMDRRWTINNAALTWVTQIEVQTLR